MNQPQLLGGGPVCAGEPMAGRGHVSVDLSGEQQAGDGDIIGLGRMGSAIAVRLSAFGLDRVPQP